MSCTRAKTSVRVIANSASRFYAYRAQRIAEVQEPFIQEAMKRTWLQKLLGKPARTREQAIDWLKNESAWSDYNLIRLKFYREQEIFNNLMALAKVSNQEEIELSSEDARIVERWTEEQ